MRGADQPVGYRARVIDAAVFVHQGANIVCLSARSLGAGPREESGDARAFGGGGFAEEPDEHQRSFALENVSIDFLAVTARIADEVEQVVLDLESAAEKEAEADKRLEVELAAGADEGADAARMYSRQPAGLLEYEFEVVSIIEVQDVIAAPTDFDRLTLGGLQRH